jgi:uncharacterized protein (TIGR03492 family)
LRLLVLSNGHGEDEVAVRVLRQLRQLCLDWDIQALPIVGEGSAYRQAGIEIYGPTQAAMPSGGFLYMSQKAILNDVRSGLLRLTVAQLKACRKWATQPGCILAVGDIVPLLFARWSGAPFTFIGTAKSEYYLRSELPDFSTRRAPLTRWLDCVYQPWERWLMQSSCCKAVFPRDRLTATLLKQWPIPVADLGNPMLDDLTPQGVLLPELFPDSTPVVLLMPGSRPPEAYANWQLLLQGIAAMTQLSPLIFVAAIARQLDLDIVAEAATQAGWRSEQLQPLSVPCRALRLGTAQLLIVQNAFNDALHKADVAIATAGTATEQFVGLGKPVVTLAGDGPQFTWAFAEAQSRLLGPSIQLVDGPEAVSNTILSLLQSPEDFTENGQLRMGLPGASERIARHIQELFK